MPKLLLLRMAVTALDKDKPPVFYGGRTALAAAIGRVVPDPPTRGDRSAESERIRRERDDAFKAVERAMRPLTYAGAVILLNRPGVGERAAYELCLDARRAPRSPGGCAPRSPGGSSPEEPPGGCPKCPPLTGGPRSKEQEEVKFKEEEKEEGSSESPPHLTRAPEKTINGVIDPPSKAPKITKPIGASDHGCIRGWLPDASGGRGTSRCPTCHPTAQEAS